MAGQLDQSGRAELGAGAVRDVVEHDRQGGGIGHGQAVRDNPGLRGPGVVRRTRSSASAPASSACRAWVTLWAVLLVPTPAITRARCRARRATVAISSAVSAGVESGTRGGAGHDETVAPGGQHVVDQTGDRVLAHPAVGAHRGDRGHQAGSELRGVVVTGGVVVMLGCHGPIFGAPERCGPAMVFRGYCVAWLHG